MGRGSRTTDGLRANPIKQNSESFFQLAKSIPEQLWLASDRHPDIT